MKAKEGLAVKIIKRFYGISGVLDEYKKPSRTYWQ